MNSPAHETPDSPLMSLVVAYIAGDKLSADRLCEVLRPSLLRTAGRFCADQADAQDVVQETLICSLDYLRRRGEFSGDFAGFCNTVAANRCKDYLRRRRRPDLPLGDLVRQVEDPAPDVLQAMLKKERHEELQRALNNLDPMCRKLLRGFYLEGRTIEAILVESDVDTVQSIYYRRKRCLNKLLSLMNIDLFGRCISEGINKNQVAGKIEGGDRNDF